MVRQTERKWVAALINTKMLESVCTYANCMHARNGVDMVCVCSHVSIRQIFKFRPGGQYLCEAGRSQITSDYCLLLPMLS